MEASGCLFYFFKMLFTLFEFEAEFFHILNSNYFTFSLKTFHCVFRLFHQKCSNFKNTMCFIVQNVFKRI